MILLNMLHILYVVDFFINEDWYLRTMDIAHDHFGFMLSWGDSVWLPFMYTLQSHYLVKNPFVLTNDQLLFFAILGSFGYFIFRSVNHQKDICRRTNGVCKIWGKPAVVIRATYKSTDGVANKSVLLCSGFWGVSRHFNYLGDLILSFAMCLTCGFNHLLPYFYIVYMAILLVHRIERDEQRCSEKYGRFWKQYCEKVRYKLIPYLY